MFDAYNSRMSALGGYEGNVRRNNSQKIMDASWMRDTATRPVYVKWVDSGLPTIGEFDEVLYAKYNVKSYHNITGDAVAYLLQFRLEDMKNRPDIKVGSYVQIYNEMNEPEWWLIVHYDDRPQFRQFSILKCTWTYRWVSIVSGRRRIYECLGAPRKQNSYNSGVWLDYTTQTVENQEVMWLPTNSDTKTIHYDCKFLKSEIGRMPPLAYKVSKIEDTAAIGITKFTMTQEMYDPSRDDAELMIGNYYASSVEPELPKIEEPTVVSNFEITHSGTPSVRAGGGFKKFTLKKSVDGQLDKVTDEVNWYINGLQITKTVEDEENSFNLIIKDENDSDVIIAEALKYTLENNVFRVKCTNNYSLIGETFNVSVISGDNSKSLTVEVTSL